MPVTIAHYTLLVVKAALELRYPGGLIQAKADLDFDPIRWADQEDAELLRLASDDRGPLTERLHALHTLGLRYDHHTPAENDLVIIARYGGPNEQPSWLRYNAIYAWHRDCAEPARSIAECIKTLIVDEFVQLREAGEIPVGAFG